MRDDLLPKAGFAIETFQTDEGLPQNSINAIVQSRRGYLWIGTYSGLVRFDGARFTVFDSSGWEGIRDSRVTSLYESADGTLWMGHETGVVTVYRDGVFEPVDLGTQAPRGQVVGISESYTGEILLSDAQGYITRVGQQPLRESLAATGTSPAGLPSMCRDAAGRVWINYRGVVRAVIPGGLASVEFEDSTGTLYVVELIPSGGGGLWVITASTLRKWRDGEWVANWGPCPWGDSYVSCGLETRDGRLVIGTLDQGVYVLGPTRDVVHLSTENGLPHDWIRSLCEDHEGNLWVGTSGAGLCVLRRAKVALGGPPDRWLGRGVLSLAPASGGDLWAGTEGAGLYSLTAGGWSHYGPAEGLPNPFIWSVLEDRQGTLRVGTWGEGLFVKGETGFSPAPGWSGLQIPVTALCQTTDGSIWAGTERGLVRMVGTNQTWVYGDGVTTFADVRTIIEDASGVVWFGTTGHGLGRFRKGSLDFFSKQNGLASDFILSLLPDEDGSLWIGTMDNGLGHLRDGRCHTINEKAGLANNVIGGVADDGRGNLWLSSQQGLLRVSKSELLHHAEDPSAPVQCLVYGKRQGLTSLACSAGFSPLWCRTTQGRLVFPTARGIAVVDPRDVEPNLFPPEVHVEEVLVQETRIATRRQGADNPSKRRGGSEPRAAAPEWIELTPDERRLEIHYTALSFVDPAKVQFQYRLTPLEREWVAAGTRRSANYSFVPPGDYTFEVIACNNDGLWNESGAQLDVRVLPHFWETWTFRIFMGCVAAGAVAGLVFLDARRRLRRKLEKVERERLLERERSRIAHDIHDDLGASLTRILMLTQEGGAATEEEEVVADNMREAHRTARELTRAMDEIVWAVNPQHDTLESLVNYLCRYAQSFLSSAQLSCRLDAPLNLPARSVRADVRHNLFLAFKEALNNVVKHAQASKVWVSIRTERSQLEIELRDNGRGLATEIDQARRATDEDPDRVESGLGFDHMRHRITSLGGACRISSIAGEGTLIEFSIPL